MKFNQVITPLNNGKSVRRSCWPATTCMRLIVAEANPEYFPEGDDIKMAFLMKGEDIGLVLNATLTAEDICAVDWKILPDEPAKEEPLTAEPKK